MSLEVMRSQDSLADVPNEAITNAETARVMFEALQQRAAEAGVTLRTPPPEPTTCCGRGCNGCVWEGYFSAAAYWREDAETALNAASGLPVSVRRSVGW
jgi:hypothetical protein